MRHKVFELEHELCQIAHDAGSAVMRIYEGQSPSDVRLANKADDSPLTKADLASHHLIVERLTRLQPTMPVVSEEDADSIARSMAEGSYWLIDPLDGTKEFLARNGEFTINIALIANSEPVWGVVYAPALDQMFWGGLDYGSYRKHKGKIGPMQVAAPVESGKSYRVVASKSHLNAATSGFIEQLGATELVQVGSSLKFCTIAEGRADVYPRLAPTCEWDTAAAQAVLEGAGGWVYDTSGTRLRYGKPNRLNPSFIAASVALSALRSRS
jgi:3'(2'), 5'-bisphosphate nucleotidase